MNSYNTKFSLAHQRDISAFLKMKTKDDDPQKVKLPGSQLFEQILLEPKIEVILYVLILTSSLLVALETVSSIPTDIHYYILLAGDIIGSIFVLEFFARWYSQNLSSEHLAQPFTIIDLLVISPVLIKFLPASIAIYIPAALTSSSGLINLRLLRVLRFQRVLADLETFKNFEMGLGLKASEIRPYQLQLARVLVSIFTLLSVSTGLMYTAEHNANPENFPDYFTALYFGLTTLTTVGFGDITPITFQGRLVVCGSILAGVAVVPVQAASLFEALLDYQMERDLTRGALLEKDKMKSEQKELKRLSSITELDASATESGTLPKIVLVGNESNQTCSSCNASPHRVNARFCWNCGKLLSSSEVIGQDNAPTSSESKSSNSSTNSFA